jgi:hypothetical protein
LYKWIGARDFLLVIEFLRVLALLYFIPEIYFHFDLAAFSLDDNVARSISFVDQVNQEGKAYTLPLSWALLARVDRYTLYNYTPRTSCFIEKETIYYRLPSSMLV